MPHADNLSRALLALILLCLVVGILRDGGDASEAAALRTHGERYDVQVIALGRQPALLLRTDSATGEAWRMGAMGPSQWQALREGPDGVPSAGADEPGRYRIHTLTQRKGAPNLIRTDARTGRLWRKGLSNDGAWVAVPNPGQSPGQPPPAAAAAQ